MDFFTFFDSPVITIPNDKDLASLQVSSSSCPRTKQAVLISVPSYLFKEKIRPGYTVPSRGFTSPAFTQFNWKR